MTTGMQVWGTCTWEPGIYEDLGKDNAENPPTKCKQDGGTNDELEDPQAAGPGMGKAVPAPAG